MLIVDTHVGPIFVLERGASIAQSEARLTKRAFILGAKVHQLITLMFSLYLSLRFLGSTDQITVIENEMSV